MMHGWYSYSENGCSVIWCVLQVLLLWLMLIGLHFVFCLFLSLVSAHPSSLRETPDSLLCIWRSLWPEFQITLPFSCIQHQFCFKLVSGRFYQMFPRQRSSLMSEDWDELVILPTTYYSCWGQIRPFQLDNELSSSLLSLVNSFSF